MKDSFVFYLSQYEAVKDLENEQLGRLFRAIFEKQLGNEVVLENDIKIAFNFINNQMVVDRAKYLKKCETLKNNAKKGGAPKGNKNASKQKQPKQPNREKNNLNDNEHDNDNDNDNDNVISTGVDINIYTYIENNFGRTLSPIEYETISNWKDNELTRYAIKKAVLNGKHNITYISRILESYATKGITTVVQAQQEEEDFKNQKEQMKKYQGVGFKESKADWQEVEIDENTATADEIRELEERIRGR